MNIKLTLEYDGTRYQGWQIQPRGETIQGVLEKALCTIAGEPVRVTGSGRTDAGVHALGQTANFFMDQVPDPHRLERAINALTPPDITVKSSEFVPDSFDARRDGRSRVYAYRILNRSAPSPFHSRYAWHVHHELDVPAMRGALAGLEGKHDFSAFRAAGCDAANPVRTVYRVGFEQSDDLLVLNIEATAFLRHMVRNIVGTLVEVGRSQRTLQSFHELLGNRDRTKAGPKAPARGLFLMKVRY